MRLTSLILFIMCMEDTQTLLFTTHVEYLGTYSNKIFYFFKTVIYCSRILFAEYFNPKNIYSLLGYIKQEENLNIEITVLSSQDFVEIKSTIQLCLPEMMKNVVFVELKKKTSSNYFSSSLLNYKREGYDYVEYHGASISGEKYKDELEDLASV